MANGWKSLALTVAWLGLTASAMAQPLPPLGPPPANANLPGRPVPVGIDDAPLAPVGPPGGFAPAPPPPPEGPIVGPLFTFGAAYLAWATPRQHLPILVTAGSSGDPIPAALGQPRTRVVLQGRIGQDTPHSGMRFNLGLGLDDAAVLALEGNFFLLEQRSGHRTYTGDGAVDSEVLGRPFFNLATNTEDAYPIAIPGVAFGRIDVETRRQMYGGEGNLRYNYLTQSPSSNHRIDFVAGFRYVAVNEALTIKQETQEIQGPGVAGNNFFLSEDYITNNNFYGGQVGGQWEYRLGPGYVSARAVCGLGGTYQTLKTAPYIRVTEPTGVVSSNTDRALYLSPPNVGQFNRTRFCVVPEGNVRCGFDLAPGIGLAVGYSYIYVSDVIRPATQIDRRVTLQPVGTPLTVPPAQQTPSFNSTSFWAQGIDATLLLRF